ncbi:CLUMA_CG016886, isoform A [Clunio marinus]|uniref:CLUMA_CG016886, isoform A n=1 Tax=Clunio marinus TaxID=568069 RepID=A0A1J1IUK2_9DIPT|nr:CLUMA_CG016886, isoform A [Clunio marinus]
MKMRGSSRDASEVSVKIESRTIKSLYTVNFNAFINIIELDNANTVEELIAAENIKHDSSETYQLMSHHIASLTNGFGKLKE